MFKPWEEFTNTSESPEPKEVEKAKSLSSQFAGEDFVYELKWKSWGYVHGQP